ncbi:protein FAM234B-like [Argonauta hians]
MWKFRKSRHENVVYAPLQQTFSDDDDADDDFEDDILFDKDLTISSASRNGGKRFGKDVIELENLQGSRFKLRDRHRRRPHGGCCTRRLCLVLTCLLFLLLVVAVTVSVLFPRYLPSWFSPHPSSSSPSFPSQDWNLTFGNYVSDSCIRLVDVDCDGQLDIIVSVSDYSSMATPHLNVSCRNQGVSCGGQILAVRGYDGKRLWQLPTRSTILYIQCDHLDVDQDGQYDCLVSGHHATLQAIDPRKGVVIWTAASDYIIDPWSMHQPLVVPDVNHDQVDDVLVLHGDCCYYGNYGNTQPLTNAGRFLLFSGATGKSLGTYVNLTEGRMFQNPVLYWSSNNSLNVLYSSGHLHSPGGLHHVYWEVLKKDLLDPQVFQLSGTKTIYRSLTNGIVVPPVIVDLRDSGEMAVLLSAFDGNLSLYDGTSFDTRWSTNFAGYQSFSIPAPGYFNNDRYLDFMVHLNYGNWPSYSYSMVAVISGKDGTLLWEMASSLASLSSDLTLHTLELHRDVFVFSTFDREGPVQVDSSGNITTTTTLPSNQPYQQTDPGVPVMSASGYSRVCSVRQESSLTEEVFIMDRTSMASPLLLAHNTYTPSTSSPTQPLCMVVKPLSRGTGAIGDVDGDGQPDYISLTSLATEEYRPSEQQQQQGEATPADTDTVTDILRKQNVTLHKRALSAAIRTGTRVPIDIYAPHSSVSEDSGGGGGGGVGSDGGDGGGKSSNNNNNDDDGVGGGGIVGGGIVGGGGGGGGVGDGVGGVEFVPQREQVWTEYLGRRQTGVYRRQHLSDGGDTMSRRSRVLYYLVVLFSMLVLLL